LVPGDLNSEQLPKTSSRPSDEPEDRFELFHDVLELLKNSRIPFAVSGAFSLRQHTGICRYTKDLDLFLTAENSPAALHCLRAAGMECEITDPVWLSKAWRDGYFVDMITGMSNGLITVQDSWIQRARPAVIYGVETRVLAPEELVASKIFVAKRERFDGADIAHVIYGTYGEFDWKRELELVGPHWEMLLWSLMLFRYVYPAQSHYVPSEIWCELLTRFTHAVKNPNPNAVFRGSVIDENMFAIDVDEWELPNLLEETRRLRLERVRQNEQLQTKPARKRA